jgi:hypothetical protein
MNNYRTAFALFAAAVIISIIAAFVTTREQVDTRQVANNQTPPGTTGLAKSHPPLDRSPDQPIFSGKRDQ